MRKISFIILVAGLLSCSPSFAQNQNGSNSVRVEKYTGYLTQQEVPNDLVYLPAPPDSSSEACLADKAIYEKSKSLRSGKRGMQAIRDVSTDTDSILHSFSEAFGMEITPTATPAIYELIARSKNDIRLGVNYGKRAYMRTRPYVYFNESTPLPEEDEELRHTGSYPSGHSVRGWGIALLLAEINPERQNEILERGYQYGQSRVILGFHYQSDVDAARLVASAVVARLHADKDFEKQMKRARKEFSRLSRKQKALQE